MKFLKNLLIAVLIIAMPMVALAAPNDILSIDYMRDAPGSDFSVIDFVKVIIN